MYVTPVKYYVSLLPEDYPDRYLFTVTVEKRAREKWAVYKGAYSYSSLPEALNSNGTWDYEGSAEREDLHWLDSHRFSLDEALKLAQEVAPSVGVMGFIAEDLYRKLLEGEGHG